MDRHNENKIIAKVGGAAPVVIATGEHPAHIKVDATNIYGTEMVNAGNVRRLAK